MVETHHHRPTLKQQNKKYKSKHASKSSLKDAAKGKDTRSNLIGHRELIHRFTGRIAKPASGPAHSVSTHARLNRKNNAKQTQAKKKEAIISATKVFQGSDGAPRVVSVIPLTEDVDVAASVAALAESLEASVDGLDGSIWRMRAERFKTTLQFIPTIYNDTFPTLDAVKASDYILLLLSPTIEVGEWGDTLLRCLQAQGLPTVVSAIPPPPPGTEIDAKVRPGILKSLLSFMKYFIPTQARVFDLGLSSDKLNAVRALAEGAPGEVRWRSGRSWIVGEEVGWEGEILKVTGVVRGFALSPNRLVCIPGFGDFQIQKILSASATRLFKYSNPSISIEVEPKILAEPDPSSADSLISSNDPDDMENEQTWPTEEEMRDGTNEEEEELKAGNLPDAKKGTTPKAIKRVPKGTSDYQASWIIEEDEDEGGEIEDDEDEKDAGMLRVGGGEVEDILVEKEPREEDERMDIDTEGGRGSVAFQDLDFEEEALQLEKWRARKREDEVDLAFPDEIDTPKDIPARVRFARYRGLRSFRTSPWDPYENLPRDYARIFQFEDFKRTERSVRRRAEMDKEVIQPGVRVTVYLKGVPREVAQETRIILFPLMQHEHKMTVLHFTVLRNTEFNGSVRSKDPLILCIGPRRLSVQPIYSQHTRGGGKGVNNVHKFERYLRPGVVSVASVYAPVVFGNQPVTLMKETKDTKNPQLVAMGTFMNPDTTRIVAKRIILTGHPIKIHKKTATVRYLFFNPDDIQYFRPIQLHTKYGRTGHIQESLGTHGYLKARFDGPLTQMDTVCMNLYKRVFPRWTTVWRPSVTGLPEGFGDSEENDRMEE